MILAMLKTIPDTVFWPRNLELQSSGREAEQYNHHSRVNHHRNIARQNKSYLHPESLDLDRILIN